MAQLFHDVQHQRQRPNSLYTIIDKKGDDRNMVGNKLITTTKNKKNWRERTFREVQLCTVFGDGIRWTPELLNFCWRQRSSLIKDSDTTVEGYQRKRQRRSSPPMYDDDDEEDEGYNNDDDDDVGVQWIDDTPTEERGIWYFASYHPLKISFYDLDEYKKLLRIVQQPTTKILSNEKVQNNYTTEDDGNDEYDEYEVIYAKNGVNVTLKYPIEEN